MDRGLLLVEGPACAKVARVDVWGLHGILLSWVGWAREPSTKDQG